jgi:hypothetical protein
MIELFQSSPKQVQIQLDICKTLPYSTDFMNHAHFYLKVLILNIHLPR